MIPPGYGETLSRLKTFVPAAIYLLYSFIGAIIYKHIEFTDNYVDWANSTLISALTEPKADPPTFWAALFYVNSLGTTIGYGNTNPKTVAGQVFVVFYVILGIPITFMLLDNIGQIIFYVLTTVWSGVPSYRKVKKLIRRSIDYLSGNTAPSDKIQVVVDLDSDGEAAKAKEVVAVPIKVGIIITICWIVLGSALTKVMEPQWSFWECIYFNIITLTTIGLGDYVPTNFNLTLFTTAISIVGLSLVSVCIQLVITSVEELFTKIEKKIEDKYKEKLAANAMVEFPTAWSDSQNEDDEISQLKRIDSIIEETDKSKSRFMKLLLSKNQKRKLIRFQQRRDNCDSKFVQAVELMNDVGIDAPEPDIIARGTQTDTWYPERPEQANKRIQVTVPTETQGQQTVASVTSNPYATNPVLNWKYQ